MPNKTTNTFSSTTFWLTVQLLIKVFTQSKCLMMISTQISTDSKIMSILNNFCLYWVENKILACNYIIAYSETRQFRESVLSLKINPCNILPFNWCKCDYFCHSNPVCFISTGLFWSQTTQGWLPDRLALLLIKEVEMWTLNFCLCNGLK